MRWDIDIVKVLLLGGGRDIYKIIIDIIRLNKYWKPEVRDIFEDFVGMWDGFDGWYKANVANGVYRSPSLWVMVLSYEYFFSIF